MIGRGSVSILRVGLVLVLALAAAVAANIVLLRVATGPKDPVGRLSPRAGIVQLPAGSAPVAQPSKAGDGEKHSGDGRGRESADD